MKDSFFVEEKYRKNQLSKIPGGNIIKVVPEKGSSKFYNNIKFPNSYISKLKKDNTIIQIWLNDELVYDKLRKNC